MPLLHVCQLFCYIFHDMIQSSLHWVFMGGMVVGWSARYLFITESLSTYWLDRNLFSNESSKIDIVEGRWGGWWWETKEETKEQREREKGGMKVVTGNKGGGEPLGRNPFCSPLEILPLLLLRLLLETTRHFVPLFLPPFLSFLFLCPSFSSLSFSFLLLSFQSTVFPPPLLSLFTPSSPSAKYLVLLCGCCCCCYYLSLLW